MLKEWSIARPASAAFYSTFQDQQMVPFTAFWSIPQLKRYKTSECIKSQNLNLPRPADAVTEMFQD